jgi:hypothetical protein
MYIPEMLSNAFVIIYLIVVGKYRDEQLWSLASVSMIVSLIGINVEVSNHDDPWSNWLMPQHPFHHLSFVFGFGPFVLCMALCGDTATHMQFKMVIKHLHAS